MNNTLINHYDHTWRVFADMVRHFDPDTWLHTVRGAITPARLSLHILQSVKYYIEDPAAIELLSGKSFECNWVDVEEAALPSQEDLLACLADLQAKTSQWLAALDLGCQNDNQAWSYAGPTKFSLALFLLRHTLFHVGELSSLLNESKNGAVEDIYVKVL